MNGLQIFNNDEFGQIRTVEIDHEPWLVAKDVADALGYANSRDAVATHVDDEDKGVAKCDVPQTLDRRAYSVDYTIINESGLYALIFGSKLPTAKKFKRWVTSEVLPTIRKTGNYSGSQELSAKDRIKVMQCIGKASRYTLPYIILAAKPFLGDIDLDALKHDDSSAKPRDRITEGIQLYLNDHDIIGRPTGECHDEYVEFCKANHLAPTNKINFSRKVLEFGQVQILLKKLNGKTRRIFIRR